MSSVPAIQFLEIYLTDTLSYAQNYVCVRTAIAVQKMHITGDCSNKLL